MTATTPPPTTTIHTKLTLRVRRTRGVVNGVLVVILGLFGALIPLIGPSFDFGYTPDETWAFTNGQWLMEIAPGGAAVLGGLLLIFAADRATGTIGGLIASAGGAWFVVGPVLTPLWDDDGDFIGSPLGTTKSGDHTNEIVAEQLTLFFGLGLLIVFLAAVAGARYSVFGVGDVRASEEAAQLRVLAKDQRRSEKEAEKARKQAEKEAARAQRQADKDAARAQWQAEKDAARAQQEADNRAVQQAMAHPPVNTPQHAPEPGLNTPSSGAPLPPYPGPTTSEPPTQAGPPQPPGWSPPGGTPRG